MLLKHFLNVKNNFFAYRKVWGQYPHLDGDMGLPSNHKEVNRKVDLVARHQYGFRKLLNYPITASTYTPMPIYHF